MTKGFPFLVIRHQIGVYLFYFLCNQTKSDRTRRFNLRFITKAYRPEPVDGFTGLIDRLDIVLETPRRHLRAESAICIDIDCLGSAGLIPRCYR